MDLTPLSHSPRVSRSALTKTQWLKIYTGASEKEGKKTPPEQILYTQPGEMLIWCKCLKLWRGQSKEGILCVHIVPLQSTYSTVFIIQHTFPSNKITHTHTQQPRIPSLAASSACIEIPRKLRLQCSPRLSGWAGCELHWQLALGCAQPPFCSVQHHAPTRDWSN